MPILSLPLPRLPVGVIDTLPIRVPFPFMRIASILPQAINEPIKNSLMALFKLAWSAKLQIPVLITVVFMACDIRLQLEINIFWETNHRPNPMHNRNTGQRRSSREDMRRAALVAAALYQQQRRRLIQEMRAQQIRQREAARGQSLPANAPLATEEDSDLEGSHEENLSESDTLTCSQRSTASEAGSFRSDNDIETDEENYSESRNSQVPPRRKRKRRPASPSRDSDDEEEEEDENTTTDEEDEDDDDEDDDDGGGGMNGGSSSHGGAGGYRDDTYDEDDDDSDELDDSSHGGGGYSSPLVLEIELRHRPLHPSNAFNQGCQMPKAQNVIRKASAFKKDPSIFSLFKDFSCRNRNSKASLFPTTMPEIYLLL